ncbi:MAG TPA: universal stress protein [Chloroflexota bacterium]|nr:universal stress protein [Chloroflexota bacterium]
MARAEDTMDLFRSLRKGQAEAASAEIKPGNVLLPVNGNVVDDQVVRLACTLVRRQQGTLTLMHIIEVPRSFPLDADVNIESSRHILDVAADVAEQLGVQARTEIIQARDAGATIVEEARNMGAGLILLGLPRLQRMGSPSMGRTVPYVLLHGHCRVIVVRPA